MIGVVLVVPAFPLPFCLTSNPAIFLLNITEKFILPSGDEATMEVFSDTGELLYTNKIEHGSSN